MAKFIGHTVFINNATFAKKSCGQSNLWGMPCQPNKWYVPGMLGMAGVVVRKRAV